MFNRGGSHNKFEITAPPTDLANKLRLQHPPPALLLQERKSIPTTTSSASKTNLAKQPVHRQRSQPILDSDERTRHVSGEVNRIKSPSTNVHNQISDKPKKKTVFSFLKKKQYKDVSPPRRAMAQTPEFTGRKRIQYDIGPGSSVPLVRRPNSASSDRRNGVGPLRKLGGFLDSEDEDIDVPRTGYPRFKPARVAPPIPINASKSRHPSNSGYNSLEKYKHSKNQTPPISSSNSDDGSLNRSVHSDLPSGSLSSSQGTTKSTVCPPLPGLTGIKNHGNTCFMNAVIQCLNSTEPLLKYFLTGAYQRDLAAGRRKRRVLHAVNQTAVMSNDTMTDDLVVGAPDSEGGVTEYIGILIKSLWNGQYEARVSAFVREMIGWWSEQYRGRKQHDAQEFLLWLLDHLHEDLNRATGQRMTRSPSRKSSEEEEQAAETLSDHLQRHDSLIYDLFGAQYHSSLRCPSCNYPSNTFDPYLCVSLSVPRRGSRPVYITMARRHQNCTKLMVFGLSVKVNATVKDIQRQLSVEARTLPHYLVIGDMKRDGFYRFFRPNDPVSAIGDYSPLYAFEVTPHRGDFSTSVPHPSSLTGGTGETIFIILQCRVGQGEYSKRFGSPMCLRVWRDLTYSQLQSVVFKNMRHFLHEGVNPEVVCREYIFFKCLVMDGLQGQEHLDAYCPSPLMTPSVEKALSVSKLWGYEPHIKIIAEWEQWVKDTVCNDIPEVEDPVHPSVQGVRQHYSTPLEASLDDCLEWHTKEETLDEEETYRCHQCCQPQAGATKRISFWTLPDILVLHFKRFELDEYSQSKLNTMVKFPVRGLNMTPYLTRPDHLRSSSAMGFKDRVIIGPTNAPPTKNSSVREAKSSYDRQGSSDSLPLKNVGFEDLRKAPKTHASSKSQQFILWKKKKKSDKLQQPTQSTEGTPPSSTKPPRETNIYDLYAICNHHGNMDSGHYIAYCCNPVDGQWYVFDDHHVLPVADLDHLVTQHAYVLFYLRRGAKRRYSLLSDSNDHEHWVYKLLKFKMDLSRLIPAPEPVLTKPQRHASATSAQTVSTSSKASSSSNNMLLTSPPHLDQMGTNTSHTHFHLPPPSSLHSNQFSSGSSGGLPSSPQSVMTYPQSLPSPLGHTPVPNYFSQQSTNQAIFFGQSFTKRTSSFHGRLRNNVPSKKDGGRSATRL